MQLKPENIQTHLSKNALLPAYIISGDEPLLIQEAADALRSSARLQGFTEREVFTVDQHFDWDSFLAETNSPSLFADKKTFELRVSTIKSATNGSAAIEEFCAAANPDNLLIIIAPKLDKRALKSKWATAIDKIGAILQVWPVSAEQLPRWINRRLTHAGIKATPQAAEMLAVRVEGNLLAAAQEVEKLKMLSIEGTLDETTISNVVSESARYNVFSLCDKALEGDTPAACRMLQGLKNEGTDSLAILWLLTREIRILKRLTEARETGQSLESALSQLGVWKSRVPLMKRAAQRFSSTKVSYLLRLARAVDKSTKGVRNSSPWDDLTTLIIMLSGQQPLKPETLQLSLRTL